MNSTLLQRWAPAGCETGRSAFRSHRSESYDEKRFRSAVPAQAAAGAACGSRSKLLGQCAARSRRTSLSEQTAGAAYRSCSVMLVQRAARKGCGLRCLQLAEQAIRTILYALLHAEERLMDP
ncbi:hypothetical protein FGB62_107g04 [Gracilaria domingensis]|nr:hypothetical protein FGB62_107g04 [Gracilaria domingensis]